MTADVTATDTDLPAETDDGFDLWDLRVEAVVLGPGRDDGLDRVRKVQSTAWPLQRARGGVCLRGCRWPVGLRCRWRCCQGDGLVWSHGLPIQLHGQHMCALRGLVVTLNTRTAPTRMHVVGLRTAPDSCHAIRTEEHGTGQDEGLCLLQARARMLAAISTVEQSA